MDSGSLETNQDDQSLKQLKPIAFHAQDQRLLQIIVAILYVVYILSEMGKIQTTQKKPEK